MKSIYSLASVCLALFVATPLMRAADSTQPKETPAAAADSPKPGKPVALPDPVAVVDGVDIKKAELIEAFDAVVTQAGKKPEEITEDQKLEGYKAILNDLITDKILAKDSEKQTVTDADVDEYFNKFKAQFQSEEQMNTELKQAGQSLDKIKVNIRASLKQQKWIDAQIAGKDTVTDADAQEFYDKHPDYFKVPDTVRASHILIAVPEGAKPEEVAAKEKKAKDIADQAKKGGDFAKLAKENSEDPASKENGGDLDFFPRDRMAPEFADAAFKMNKGDISDPVKTQFGFHIIKVTDKKDARTVPFSEVKEKIISYLKETKHKAAVEELIAGLRAKADVKINLPGADKAPAPEGLTPAADIKADPDKK
jgi:peptidyl-prolyl cis-trans isomerase C